MVEAFAIPSKAEEAKPILPHELPRPSGYHILIEMIEPKTVSKGGVILADSSIEAQEYLRYVGKVAAVGPYCYKGKDEFAETGAWCQPGDWVAFGQHAGQNLEIRGRKFRLVKDIHILAVIPDPSILKIYIE